MSTLYDERVHAGEMGSSIPPQGTVLARDDQTFLQAHPFSSLPQKPRSRTLRSFVTWGIIPLAAALVLLPLLPQEERTKGAEVSLSVFHKTSSGAERLANSSVLQKGDEIQLAYAATRKLWVAIYSVDGRGTLTLHFPVDQREAMAVEPGKTTLLPFSYRLDDAPAFELFVMISGDHAFAVESLMPAVQLFAKNPNSATTLTDGLTATSFRVLKKESRP